MRINTFVEKIRSFLNSPLFLGTVAILAFLTWLLPTPFYWIPATLYLLLGFLPLFGKDGRSYLLLFLGNMFLEHDKVSFSSLPFVSIVVGAALLLSLVIYLILHRPVMRLTPIFWSLLLLSLVFFSSYLYVAFREGNADIRSILYLLAFIYFLVIYLLLCSVIGNEETLPYYSTGVVFFSLIISFEVFIGILVNSGLGLATPSFSIGWSYTRETASTLLLLSLPFYSILIHEKKPYYFLLELFPIAAILLLSTNSGLSTFILFVIPLTILTLQNYGKYSNYFTLFILFGFAGLFGLLMGVNHDFNFRVGEAFGSLLYFGTRDTLRRQITSDSISAFLSNPILGSSITTFVQNDGTLRFSFNTVLSTMVMGGSIGLAAYVLYEVILYLDFAKKKNPAKWLFLLFILMVEVIGVIDNTIYNLTIYLFFLTSLCCFEMTSRPEDLQIHEDYFLRPQNKEE